MFFLSQNSSSLPLAFSFSQFPLALTPKYILHCKCTQTPHIFAPTYNSEAGSRWVCLTFSAIKASVSPSHVHSMQRVFEVEQEEQPQATEAPFLGPRKFCPALTEQ